MTRYLYQRLASWRAGMRACAGSPITRRFCAWRGADRRHRASDESINQTVPLPREAIAGAPLVFFGMNGSPRLWDLPFKQPGWADSWNNSPLLYAMRPAAVAARCL